MKFQKFYFQFFKCGFTTNHCQTKYIHLRAVNVLI